VRFAISNTISGVVVGMGRENERPSPNFLKSIELGERARSGVYTLKYTYDMIRLEGLE